MKDYDERQITIRSILQVLSFLEGMPYPQHRRLGDGFRCPDSSWNKMLTIGHLKYQDGAWLIDITFAN